MPRTANTTETPVQVADRVVATAQDAYDKTVVRLRANYEKLQAAKARRNALGPFPELDDAAVQGIADPASPADANVLEAVEALAAAANARLAAEVAVATDQTGTIPPLGAQFPPGPVGSWPADGDVVLGDVAAPVNPFANVTAFPNAEAVTVAAENASRLALARTAEQEKAHALNGLPDEARARVQAAMAAAKTDEAPAPPPAAPVNPFAGLRP